MKAEITTLKNGLRVISSCRKDIETVSVNILVNTGASYETEEVNGISHFLEHMVFKGTKNRSSIQISEDLENVGGHLNAYTSREFTSFYAKMLKNDAELAVDVLADLVLNPTFPAEELVKEREVVVQEIKQSIDTPDDVVFDYLQEKCFPNQSWGRTILGPAEKVRSFDEKTLNSYMKTNYAANNMVISAVGNIAHDKFVKMVEDRMSNLRKKTSFKVPEARYGGGFSTHKKDVEQAQVTLAFEGINYFDEQYYANILMSSILGGGMSSRLFKEIRENRGLAYSVYSYVNAHTQTGMNGIYAGTSQAQMCEVIPVIADEINKIRNEKVTAEELNRAKTQTKSGILMGMESSSSTADVFARQMLIFGRTLSPKEVVEKIEAVSLDDIQNMAIRIYASKPSCALLGAIDGHPTYKNIQSWLKN